MSVKYELYNTGTSVRHYSFPSYCASSLADHKVSGTVLDRVSKKFHTATLLVVKIGCMASAVYELKLMEHQWKATAMAQNVSR